MRCAPLELPGGARSDGTDAVPSAQPLALASVCFSFVSIQRAKGTGKRGVGWMVSVQEAQGDRGPWAPSTQVPHPRHQQPNSSWRDGRENTNKTKILKYLGIPTEDFPCLPCFRAPQKAYTTSKALSPLQVGPSVGLDQRKGAAETHGGWSTAGMSLTSLGSSIPPRPRATTGSTMAGPPPARRRSCRAVGRSPQGFFKHPSAARPEQRVNTEARKGHSGFPPLPPQGRGQVSRSGKSVF